MDEEWITYQTKWLNDNLPSAQLLTDSTEIASTDMDTESGYLAPTATHLRAPSLERRETLTSTTQNDLFDPMSTLPLELISEILSYCVPTNSWPYNESQRMYSSALFNLGSVCSLWRLVIWSTPLFWNFMPLVVRPGNIADTPSFAQEWIERASNLSLDVTIVVDAEHDEYFSEHDLEKFVQLANLVNASSSRLSSLVLRMSVSLLRLFAVSVGHPSNLKRICICNNDDEKLPYDDEDDENDILHPVEPWIDTESSGSNFPGFGPSNLSVEHSEPATEQRPSSSIDLNILSFARVSLNFITSNTSWNLNLNSQNLLTITAKDIDFSDIFKILRDAPQLRSLHIQENRKRAHFLTEHVPPIVHSALSELSITTIQASYIEEILRGGRFSHTIKDFKFPALKKLSIDVTESPLNRHWLVAFLERSCCGDVLEELYIHAPFSEVNDLTGQFGLIRMLKAVPRLTALRLSPHRRSDPRFTAASLFKHISQTSHRRSPHGYSSTGYGSTTESEETFLPTLESFEYSPIAPEDCKKIWPLIPDLFGIPEDSNTVADTSRRPLKSLRISYQPTVDNPTCPPPKFCKETLDRIYGLLDSGKVSIELESYHVDLEDEDDVIAFPVKRSILPLHRAL
ncbi:hypothetical protein CVT25_008084 [Psilocybe cyanescens]|uniref:Uncharacterized protein n=1 Tax=Psilocybe cyanescens TaxID=93625 RepID=A0A409WUS7_PSICY|nr:hypothetical protein CVT25_008084 [Psilocybe cyanescens]